MTLADCDHCKSTFLVPLEDGPGPLCPDCGAQLRALTREEGHSRIRKRRIRELAPKQSKALSDPS
jgi:hypothetical protein